MARREQAAAEDHRGAQRAWPGQDADSFAFVHVGSGMGPVIGGRLHRGAWRGRRDRVPAVDGCLAEGTGLAWRQLTSTLLAAT